MNVDFFEWCDRKQVFVPTGSNCLGRMEQALQGQSQGSVSQISPVCPWTQKGACQAQIYVPIIDTLQTEKQNYGLCSNNVKLPKKNATDIQKLSMFNLIPANKICGQSTNIRNQKNYFLSSLNSIPLASKNFNKWAK